MRHGVLRSVAQLIFNLGIYGLLMAALLFHPQSNLPREWNPFETLRIADPVTPLTSWRLDRVLSDPLACRAVLLDHDTDISVLPPKIADENCGIDNRLTLRRLGRAQVAPFETSCGAALRLAMWEAHSVQPLAREFLGVPVARLTHFGSYSCRKIRTTRGPSDRWSSHATASAVDISGVVLADGRVLSLLQNWDDTGPEGRFLRALHTGACRWFEQALGPDYNRLHADHFHLQSGGWPICR
ncbi:extensin family protein [Cognatishimia sp. SS12]|uniref:extensin-like domain-containing protein n=1 Tax=Cognatishimia sp. SS12 TaxID=2979465 RepID=UPI00232FEB3D|nr:extensin family protein [Cognatishimia sp. SS12]MDC0737770.1 extensin family protein [Cognatishimia sp. SS12]